MSKTQESIKALAEKEFELHESKCGSVFRPKQCTEHAKFDFESGFEKGAMLAVDENPLVRALKEIESIPEEKISVSRPNIYLEGINEGVEKCKEIASIALSSLELKPPASESRDAQPAKPDEGSRRVSVKELEEIKDAFNWTWENMATPHTSDHFNIPANGIHQLELLIETGSAPTDNGKEAKKYDPAFDKWLSDNRWFTYSPVTGLWSYTFEHGTAISKASYRKNYMKTTEELYNLFKTKP